MEFLILRRMTISKQYVTKQSYFYPSMIFNSFVANTL